MKKILVVGNYNVGNFGDDLLLMSLRSQFIDYPNCTFKIMAPGIGADFPLPPAGFKSFLSFNLFKSVSGIRWCDYVFFGGGGIFNPEEKFSLFIWGNILHLAKLYKKPVILIGQSFSPLYSGYLKYLLKSVSFVTVRDEYSFRNFLQYKSPAPVRKCSDIALNLNSEIFASNIHQFEDSEFLVLNLREFKHVPSDLTINVAKAIVDYILKNSSYSIYLVPFDKTDTQILKELKLLYKDNGKVFLLPHEKSICFAAISKCLGVISERLHASMSALVCKKPVFILSYSSKVKGVFQGLVSPHFIIDLNSDEKIDEFRIADFLSTVSQSALNYEIDDLDKLKSKSLENLRLAIDYIEYSKAD